MGVGQSNKLKVGAIIQARMSSTRMPGKILMPLPVDSNMPLLLWPITTLKKVNSIDDIVIATSNRLENRVLKDFAEENKIHFFAGSEDDVLSRFVEIILLRKFDVVVRITGDNPILDGKLIDDVINDHLTCGRIYTFTSCLPIGMNIEVIDAHALITIDKKDLCVADREHVTLHFKTNPGFDISEFKISKMPYWESVRLTVDYPADFVVLNLVAQLSLKTGYCGIELINFIHKNYSWLWEVNSSSYQKKVYSSTVEEFNAAIKILEKNELFLSAQQLKNAIGSASNL